MNPEQLTPTPAKQDLLDERDIQKVAMEYHLGVQQRDDIRRSSAGEVCSS